MTDEIKYEYKTARAVRGTDGLVISKWQKDGWELVQQTPGTLRSTLDFRRPKKPVPWLLIAAAAAVLVIVAVVIGVGSALSHGNDGSDKTTAGSQKPSATPASTPSAAATESAASEAAAAESTASESATAEPATAEPAAAAAITSQNNPQFKALLKADSCDEANAVFAAKYAGRTVAFNGSIVNMADHGDYDTRYDLLLGPGDRGPETTTGPAFKYEDVNIADLNLTGKKIPATVGEGDKFRFVAEVADFKADQCLFFLHPVSTEAR